MEKEMNRPALIGYMQTYGFSYRLKNNCTCSGWFILLWTDKTTKNSFKLASHQSLDSMIGTAIGYIQQHRDTGNPLSEIVDATEDNVWDGFGDTSHYCLREMRNKLEEMESEKWHGS